MAMISGVKNQRLTGVAARNRGSTATTWRV